MKHTCLLALACLLGTPSAHAALDIRVEFYDRGESLLDQGEIVHGIAGALPGHEFVHDWVAPLDEGVRRDRARLETLSIRLPLSRAAVRLHDVLAVNAPMSRVVFGFFRESRDRGVEEFYRVTIHHARIAALRTEMLNNKYEEQAELPTTVVVTLVYGGLDVETEGDSTSVNRLLYLQGDLNDDLELDVSDPIRLLLYLFRGAPLACIAAGDANGDRDTDIADVTFLLNYLFRHGPPPPATGVCRSAPPGASCDATACGDGQ